MINVNSEFLVFKGSRVEPHIPSVLSLFTIHKDKLSCWNSWWLTCQVYQGWMQWSRR